MLVRTRKRDFVGDCWGLLRTVGEDESVTVDPLGVSGVDGHESGERKRESFGFRSVRSPIQARPQTALARHAQKGRRDLPREEGVGHGSHAHGRTGVTGVGLGDDIGSQASCARRKE